VFDIQDVGARFYTYISTLYNAMEACAEQGKPILVLDRPNPNGHYVDGPVLDPRYKSFIGTAPIPIVHGCTVGELALMFRGEGWIEQAGRLQLNVLPCLKYTHGTPYDLPVKPSPNLPNTRAVLLYPIVCLFEGTTASLGRGTDAPFQMAGHPDFPKTAYSFTPRPNAASTDPPQKGKLCYGVDYQNLSVEKLRQWTQMDLDLFLDFYRRFPKDKKFFLDNTFFEKLAGTDALRKQILEGKTAEEIRATWAEGLEKYKTMRAKYLLYPVSN
jgi:uncharacterized protein YbbC (DUF1343 family)